VSPRVCSVCTHPDLMAINRALVEGTPNRRIASQHDVTERAIRNHKTRHLPAALAKAQEIEEVAEADSLLSQVQNLQARTLLILDKADEVGNLRTALAAIREARSNLELLAKLLGELDERPVVNLLISSEWLELRTVIVAALEPHPEVLRDVVDALESGGNGRA
jgi:hypothetical protein